MYLLLEFFNRHSQNIARATIILLVVLMTVSIGNTVLFAINVLTRDEGVVATPGPRGQSRRAESGAPQVSVAEFNLFGAVESHSSGPAVVDAPDTKLNLTLEGVFTADNAPDSTAIIAEANRPGELYHIGDTLPGRAVLASVSKDHVILQRGERYETLRFSENSLIESGTQDESDLPQGEVMQDDSALGEDSGDEEDQPLPRVRRVTRPPAQGAATTTDAQSGGKSIGEMVDFYRERLRTDPDSLMSDLGVERVETGETSGYRLGNELSQQQLQRAGLMPGDIILSVNGQPVSAVMQDQSVIDAAMAAGRVRVEVQRQQRRFFITVPIR